MFLAELVFLVELALFTSGLILFYKARKEASGLLKFASIILILGSVGTAACTGYYSFKYYKQGVFDSDRPCPHKRFEQMDGDITHHYYYEGADIEKKLGDVYHENPRD
tara:strand:+ start:115 stop:438 length:324 start_codon:yes stop_codon:yes gene_type:complete